ncbi:MAG TPA: serine hydrolase domain-containing protein [Nitrospira sp.]|nr:serine hydrolase domain-containing protein [Nitrospira sp.]
MTMKTMHIQSRSALKFLVVLAAAACLTFGMNLASAGDEDEGALQRALERFVSREGGPPGIVVVVARGKLIDVHTAGYANLESRRPIHIHDHMRLASVAKAFSGAAALSLVASGQLSLDDTIRQWLPELPQTWWPVTLAQLLNHTSGILDFSREDAFVNALRASLQIPPSPRELLAFIAGKPPSFDPGTQYRYSNSDNIIVGLMVEAATNQPYEEVLKDRVYRPLKLKGTSLPNDSDMPRPYIRGYEVQDNPPSDVSRLFAAGWTWASGGIVSTPADAILFVRGYVGGALIDQKTRAAQFQFQQGGKSEPPGPGVNSAGLALFRYETTCGTVYGHTGNTAGYTQFIAATADGRRSVVVSINGQVTPERDEERFAELRRIYELAVCAALRRGENNGDILGEKNGDILNLP